MSSLQAAAKWALPLALLATEAHADGGRVFGFVIDKQEVKGPRKWTLAEWLETRDRMKWMDLWLAMNSPSPFEFFLAPSVRFTPIPGSPERMGVDFDFGAYASISGVEINRRFAPEPEWAALLSLRLFGYHVQGTHLSAQGGIRVRENEPTPRNAFAGIEAAFYFTRFFGIEGLARHEFARAGAAADTAGLHWDAGAFIDFGALRVFGGHENDVDGESWRVGTKLFF